MDVFVVCTLNVRCPAPGEQENGLLADQFLRESLGSWAKVAMLRGTMLRLIVVCRQGVLWALYLMTGGTAPQGRHSLTTPQ